MQRLVRKHVIVCQHRGLAPQSDVFWSERQNGYNENNNHLKER